ncbi:MAG TPA: class I adenylate-forming enzyme family protein, partial [Acidimicrobiales bacterium]
MIELLRRVAGEHAAVVTDEQTVTYGELVAAAERVAQNLRRHGIQRAAIVDPDAATVLALLGGMALAGVEACQYPPVDEPAQIALLARRFDHDVLITPRTDLGSIGTVIEPADLVDTPADPWTELTPDARPLLVLTTGTTGVPRGVRHDWSRLLVGTNQARPATGQRWLLAYGLHQFAGLQVLVHVTSVGATLVAPTPRRPREGLAAMRRHRVDHASATPTYWRFLLAEMRSDGGAVPQLEQLTLGGEAIPGPL